MSKLEDRENRRRASVVAPIAGVDQKTPGTKKGRPKEDREIKTGKPVGVAQCL